MNKKDFLLSIAKGITPQQHFYRVFDFVNGHKVLNSESVIDFHQDINVVVCLTREDVERSKSI